MEAPNRTTKAKATAAFPISAPPSFCLSPNKVQIRIAAIGRRSNRVTCRPAAMPLSATVADSIRLGLSSPSLPTLFRNTQGGPGKLQKILEHFRGTTCRFAASSGYLGFKIAPDHESKFDKRPSHVIFCIRRFDRNPRLYYENLKIAKRTAIISACATATPPPQVRHALRLRIG